MRLMIILFIIIFLFSIISSSENIKKIRNYNATIKRELKDNCSSHDKSDIKGYGSIVEDIFVVNAMTDFMIFAMFATITVLTPSLVSKHDEQYSFEINSLKDNVTTNGIMSSGLFCARANINGDLRYYFSRTTDKGEFIDYVSASMSYINYDDNKTPQIIVHQKVATIPKWVKDWIMIGNQKYSETYTTEYYTIIVPSGAIITDSQYEIDME